MSEKGISLNDILTATMDFIWRDTGPLHRFIRAVFLLNYPLLVAVLMGKGFKNPVLLVVSPLIVMPLLLVLSVSANYFYLRRGCEIENKQSYEFHGYVETRFRRQTSLLKSRIYSAAAASIPFWVGLLVILAMSA